MAGDNVVTLYATDYLSRRRDSVRKCCCTRVQFRALCIIFLSIGLIFVAEFLEVAEYLIFIGSLGIFAGVFLIILDFTLYLQSKSERHHGRFGRRREDRENSIWTTSVGQRDVPSSLEAPPPDYQATMSQLDSFPLYLQDGIPSSSVTMTMNEGISNDIVLEEEDKLPSYTEVMEGNQETANGS